MFKFYMFGIPTHITHIMSNKLVNEVWILHECNDEIFHCSQAGGRTWANSFFNSFITCSATQGIRLMQNSIHVFEWME